MHISYHLLTKSKNCFNEDVKRWSEDDNAVRRLQLGLWSLEALYKLQRPLKPTIESIKEAKEQLLTQINDVSQGLSGERSFRALAY